MPKNSDGEKRQGQTSQESPQKRKMKPTGKRTGEKAATDYKPTEFRPKEENKSIKHFIQEMRFNQKLPEYQAYVQFFEALQNRLLKQLT